MNKHQKNSSVPASLARQTQFSKTFCNENAFESKKQSGGKFGKSIHDSKERKKSGHTSHEDALTYKRINSMRASQIIFDAKIKNNSFIKQQPSFFTKTGN